MEATLQLIDGQMLLNGKSKYELGIEEQILLNEMFKQFKNENFADLLQKVVSSHSTSSSIVLNNWAGRQLLALCCIFQGRPPVANSMAAGHRIAVNCNMPDNFLHDLYP